MSNEWIKWEGGECPVGETELIDIKFGGGQILKDVEGPYQYAWNWFSSGGSGDIIAYRLHCDCDGCTDGDDEIPKFLRNPFKDDGIADHEPGDGISEELAIQDVPPVLRPEGEAMTDKENKSAEWVDGLPPFGTEAECRNVKDQKWRWCRINAYDANEIWMIIRGNASSNLYRREIYEFRPIKSPKEKAAEKIMDIIASVTDPQECVENAINRIAEALYDGGFKK